MTADNNTWRQQQDNQNELYSSVASFVWTLETVLSILHFSVKSIANYATTSVEEFMALYTL